MSFFKNINATPRIGTIIMYPDGFSIYTDNGWQNYNIEYFREYLKDISDNTAERIFVPMSPEMMIF